MEVVRPGGWSDTIRTTTRDTLTRWRWPQKGARGTKKGHWQALNLNPNRNLARLRILEVKSKITIKIRKKPFRLNSMAVAPGERAEMRGGICGPSNGPMSRTAGEDWSGRICA